MVVVPRGISNVIVFAPAAPARLQQVSANGGEPKPATTDAAKGDGSPLPSFLPDRRHFLFAALPRRTAI